MTDTNTQQSPAPGIYFGVPFERYQSAMGINASLLKEGRKSMKHVRYYIDHPQPDSPAKRWGRIIHAAVFEHQTFLERYPVFDGDKRTKAWKEFKAEHEGEDILTSDEQLTALEAGAAVTAHPLVRELIDEGKPEVSAWWIDHGLVAKCRMDWLRFHGDEPVAIVDLKTAADLTPFAFGRNFERYGYHLSLGFYRRGMRELFGKELPVYVIAMENGPPWDAVRIAVPDAVLDHGEDMAVDLLKRVSQCKASGEWPGRCETEDCELHFPEYAMPDEEVAFNG